MPQVQIDEKAKAKLAQAEATAKFRAFMNTQKAQMELAQARQATQAAAMDLVNQAREKVQKEQQAQSEKAQKESSSTESMTERLPVENINAQSPAGNIRQATSDDMFTMPGGGVGDFAKGPAGPGGGNELPQVGEAPPFLVNQRRTTEVAPRTIGPVTMPMRTRRMVTDVQQNALGAGERVRAQQENWRLRQLQQVAQQKKLEETIAAESEDLGSTLFGEKEGEIAKGSTEARFGELAAQYGRTMATKILVGARAHSRGLEFDRRKAKYGSDLVEGRAKRKEVRTAAQRKAEKSGTEARPSARAKDKFADLQLKLLDGKELSNNEKKFYDAYQRSKPREIIVREAFAPYGEERKTLTDRDRVRLWGERPSNVQTPEQFRGYLEGLGYVIPE